MTHRDAGNSDDSAGAHRWTEIEARLRDLDPARAYPLPSRPTVPAGTGVLRTDGHSRSGHTLARPALAAAATLLLILVIGGLLLFGPGKTATQAASPPEWVRFSILERDQTERDRVSLPIDGIDPDSTRFAQTTNGWSLYLARGERGDRTCLIAVAIKAPSPAAGPTARSLQCWPNTSDGFPGVATIDVEQGIVGVVPDGIEWVRIGDTRVPVVANTFGGRVLPPDKSIVLGGETAEAIRLGPLGALFPQDVEEREPPSIRLATGLGSPRSLNEPLDVGPLPLPNLDLPLIALGVGDDGQVHANLHDSLDLEHAGWILSLTLLFVGPDCTTCVEQVRRIERDSSSLRYGRADIQHVLVFTGSQAEAQTWARETETSLPILVDDGRLVDALRVRAVPDRITLAPESGWTERQRGPIEHGPWVFPGYSDETAVHSRFGVLDEPAAGPIDPRIRDVATAEPLPPLGCGTPPEKLRLTTEVNGVRVFAAKDDDDIHLVVEGLNAIGVSCTAGLHQVFWMESRRPGQWLMAGVVEDGFHSVEVSGKSFPITNNGFVISGERSPETVVFRGAGKQITLEDVIPGESNGIAEFYGAAPLSQTILG